MKLTFLGADHEVTGSCHFLQAAGLNILVDCGMEQGNDVYENQELPIAASDVDCILLTHAHIDHSGLIPLMYVNGFRGQVVSAKFLSHDYHSLQNRTLVGQSRHTAS